MPATTYRDTPDIYKQNIKEVVKQVKENRTYTMDSFKKSKKVMGGQNGYQIPFYVTRYSGHTAWGPRGTDGSVTNLSFRGGVPEKTASMWVGQAYGETTVEIDLPEWNDMQKRQIFDTYARRKTRKIDSYLKHRNYYAIGDGSGALAYITSYSLGTLTCVTAATTSPGRTKGAIRLELGVLYDVITSAGVWSNSFTVTTPGKTSCVIALTGEGTGTAPAVTDSIVERGHYNNVERGLGYLISDASRDFQGLSTTTYPDFINSVVDLNGSAITPTTINTLQGQVEVRGNDPDMRAGLVAHSTPGLYRTLGAFGYGASGGGRVYNAEKGEADTTYELPTDFVAKGIRWVLDVDMDEDRVYLRRPQDFFEFEGMELQTVRIGSSDGMRMQVGTNNVGSGAFYENIAEQHNFGYDGDATASAPNCSAFVKRAAVASGTSQVTA
jgi:hypothetical protein